MPKRSPPKYKSLDTYLAGVMHQERYTVIPRLSLRDRVFLRREPNNPADPNAILVVTEDRKQLGHIRRDLAAYISPRLSTRTHPIQATVTELSCDSSGSAYRVRINFSVPEKWLIQHESVDQVGHQPIEYTCEESGANVYVSLNSSEDLFAKVRERMRKENIVPSRYGLSYRAAHNGRSYRWYLRMEKSSNLNREFIEDFFRKNFQVLPEVELIGVLQDANERSQTQIVGLQEEVKAYENLAQEIDAESRSAKLELDQKIEQLKFDVSVREDEIRQLRRVTGDKGPDDNVVDTLEEVISESLTPRQSLLVIKRFFPRRIELLDTALESADLSRQFKHRKQLFKLLWELATGYWYALASGRSDAEARLGFGDNYAAKESDRVQNNKRARQGRTFTYKGKQVPMMKHLKVGMKPGVSETLRVHFEWDAGERVIIIGHCGPHLNQK